MKVPAVGENRRGGICGGSWRRILRLYWGILAQVRLLDLDWDLDLSIPVKALGNVSLGRVSCMGSEVVGLVTNQLGHGCLLGIKGRLGGDLRVVGIAIVGKRGGMG